MRSGSGYSSDLLDALDEISKQAVRASEIIRHLRRFVRKGTPRREHADVNALVREAAQFAEPEAQQHAIEMAFHLAQGLPHVDVDSVQIEQVVLNLIRNGFEAIRECRRTQRVLSIQTRAEGERWVEVAVSDSGRGLSPEAADKAFHQFFSTKSGGLGMGLSISRSIVEAHGGRLWADSTTDEGSTFKFTLPAAKEGIPHDR